MKYSGRVLFYVQKLTQRVRVAKNRALYRTAGLIRTATKRSLRIRRGASRPPAPPHAHTRGGLREIRFIVDEAQGAALIGPLKFGTSNFFNEPVPHMHEFGGMFIARRGYWRYPKRSYMKYTLDKLVASGKIPREFSASIAEIL
jgi:hypothetical protein